MAQDWLTHQIKEYDNNLYSNTLEVDVTRIEQIIGEHPRKWSDLEADSLEGEISYTELENA